MSEKELLGFTNKTAAREYALGMRATIDKSRASDVCEKIFESIRCKQLANQNVMVYCPIGSELDTRELIIKLTSCCNVFVPYTVDGVITARKLVSTENLVADKNGNLPLRYLAEVGQVSVSVTPLVAFNRNCYRIGYGKGCYDRFFSHRNIIKIGAAFDEQLIDFLHEKHDVQLDEVITPSSVYRSGV